MPDSLSSLLCPLGHTAAHCPRVRLGVMSAEVTVDEMTCASVLWISLCRRGGSGNVGRRARACDRV